MGTVFISAYFFHFPDFGFLSAELIHQLGLVILLCLLVSSSKFLRVMTIVKSIILDIN